MEELLEIGVAFLLVAIGGLLAVKLRQSVIPAYILCGMAIGPHGFNLISNPGIIEFMSKLGVIFLLFFLGLEFSVGRLMRAGKPIISSGVLDLAINLPMGYLLGIAFGWSQMESLFLAGIVYMSSSGIITKSLTDLRRLANPETELVLGTMIFEDIFIAVFIAVLSGISLGENAKLASISLSIIKSISFCLIFIVIARRYGRRIGEIVEIESDELFVIFLFSMLLLVAGVADMIGISAAVGAFLIGLVFAETAHVGKIEEKIASFRDVFASMFFFAFGMTINFWAFGDVWLALLIAVPLSIVGKVFSGGISGKINGFSRRASLNIGFGSVSRGEFSVIISNIAMGAACLAPIGAFTALYVLILAILGPILMKVPDVIYDRL
ncbi:MAG: putative cation:proton antiport protein [Candidatus Methanolliviera sp. GoM_asphalt]|nr:MAG: putative cation:proton antiport protein [Candidatus Methanolliviera sp. GoM_asphalt]